ncbi:MAG: (Fe-S)-binding protein [Clostridiales bacterium]|nr:(Fe-S)-binding protein [Clostridiales bacterium]
MEYIFMPGCALLLYKPHLAERTEKYLSSAGYTLQRNLICCHHKQSCPPGTKMIVACSGCARRLRKEHTGIEPVSLWQVLAEDMSIKLPDYRGIKMSVHDTCPTKHKEEVTSAVRRLLTRMNINLVETELNRGKAVCCGDSFYPHLGETEVIASMRERAGQMPADNVAVYCVSCIKSMFNGGKKPHYLLDLIFGEETVPGTLSPGEWHKELQIFIEKH